MLTLNIQVQNFQFITPSTAIRRTSQYSTTISISKDGTTRINRGCVDKYDLGQMKGVLPVYSPSKNVLAFKVYKRFERRWTKKMIKLSSKDGGKVARLKSLYIDLGIDLNNWVGSYSVEKKKDIKQGEVYVLVKKLR